VKIVDANVLLYAVDDRSPHHEVARVWLEAALEAGETIGFTWVVLLAFLRLSTRSGTANRPLTIEEASLEVDSWLAYPTSALIEPGTRHTETIRGLLGPIGSAGNLVNDAHLAAIAIDNAAELVSFDADFGRFPGLRWRRPGQ
jgi:hypothetical protein